MKIAPHIFTFTHVYVHIQSKFRKLAVIYTTNIWQLYANSMTNTTQFMEILRWNSTIYDTTYQNPNKTQIWLQYKFDQNYLIILKLAD